MAGKTVTTIPGGDSFLGDKGPTEGLLIAAVLPYVLMIILLPIGSFFFTKSFVFQEILDYSDTTANVYAAISSVILLHVLLALFIIKAFKEYPAKGVKQD
ncbi:vacuolar ATPase assembly integral membrane protein vma21-like [Portunus trituberculatus]|uniref:vacuolar ATPase assembly integral membrane protein vma21-like n=1 Tax=Portunus trituberculatus TaxID=210409 RepID=UPI001E1D18E7|nr:vacuolar ATPase assembly integral membrane protein vma21-like [Portunus trituberculatus]